jgi:hypothetical protein
MTDPKRTLRLYVRDGNFVAEVAAMGHGLQMWLQTMWFLARVDSGCSIVLDEPDVYMHADLQRKLIRLIRGRYSQAIVATHSIEIMSEVTPGEIVIVDHRRQKSQSANSLPAVQDLIDRIGGVHNIQLARLWSSKKCLLVEGKDLGFLKQFQNKLFPDSNEPFDAIPHFSLGGWGGWNYAVGSSMLLKNSGGEKINVYCVLDRDYHSPKEINLRLKDAAVRNVQLRIWHRKEIENYLLVPSAIQRIIARETRGSSAPSISELTAQLAAIAEKLKEDCIDGIMENLFARKESKGPKAANMRARKFVAAAWKKPAGPLLIVGGKKVLSKLSAWSQNKFAVSLSAAGIAAELTAAEIPDEVKLVVTEIEQCTVFPS